ncbi:MAG: SIR2 family protein [Xenococcus sp. MO_188.B8]|nr:SIR2 family protein [Xenococcus sp. MO_188.B8]
MINWPRTLIQEITTRRCILFLGAGVSSSCKSSDGKRPKGWGEFIAEASQLICDEENQDIVRHLIKEGKNLLALQAIYSEVDKGDYHNFLDENFNNRTFKPSKLHDLILNLDSRFVITTNFDKIYETHCLSTSQEGFKVVTYNSESLVDEIRSDTRLIIKAHGTIDNINKMIFTRSQYHKAKRDFSRFYEVLKALFITHTVIFIGCSLDDPDIQLILEDIHIIGSGNRPHYILIREKQQNVYRLNDWRETYNIRALEYGPNHDDLVTDLENLLEQVNYKRSIQGNG